MAAMSSRSQWVYNCHMCQGQTHVTYHCTIHPRDPNPLDNISFLSQKLRSDFLRIYFTWNFFLGVAAHWLVTGGEHIKLKTLLCKNVNHSGADYFKKTSKYIHIFYNFYNQDGTGNWTPCQWKSCLDSTDNSMAADALVTHVSWGVNGLAPWLGISSIL